MLLPVAVDAATDLDTALLMRRTLLVRPNLEAVARKTDLDLTAETPQEFEALLDGLANVDRLARRLIEQSGTPRLSLAHLTG